MAGLLDAARQWMTPERAIAFQGLGMGLSQLGSGQPVNMSPAYAALEQRKQQAQMRSLMQQPGMMDRFSPQQKAALAAMPEGLATKILMESIFAPPPEPTKGVVVGDNLVNPITGQTIYQGSSKPTDDMREYDAAVAQGYKGTLQDWIIDQRKAGAVSNTINMGPTGIDYGQPPKDMAWSRAPDGSVRVDENGAPMAVMIKGSPSDASRVADITKMAGEAIGNADKAAAKNDAALTATDVITSAASKARAAAGRQNLGPTGTSVVGQLPWTDSAEVLRQTAVLKSNATIEALNQMRQQSPTGGALGNVTEKEGAMLAAKAGALDPNSPTFLRDLDDYERTLLRTIHGKEVGDKVYEATRKPGAKSPVSIDGYTIQQVD